MELQPSKGIDIVNPTTELSATIKQCTARIQCSGEMNTCSGLFSVPTTYGKEVWPLPEVLLKISDFQKEIGVETEAQGRDLRAQ